MRVLVIDNSLPYSTCTPAFGGLVVDLWKKIASEEGWTYELVRYPRKYDEALQAVNRGEYDVALGDFSVIHRRFDWVLYSRPYYFSPLKISRSDKKSSQFSIFMESSTLPYLIVIILVLIVVFALVHKLISKSSMSSSMYTTTMRFFLSATEELVEPETRRPVSQTGGTRNWMTKTFNVVWVICVFIVVNLMVAQIVSITIQSHDHITEKELLKIKKVHVLQGSSFVDYAKRLGYTPVQVESDSSIVGMMKTNPDVYWFDDSTIMRNASAKYGLGLHTTLNAQVNDEYAVAFSKQLRPEVHRVFNSRLVKMQDFGEMMSMCARNDIEFPDRCIL
jgi:ABC-type amino acid transport substrate-binding protein